MCNALRHNEPFPVTQLGFQVPNPHSKYLAPYVAHVETSILVRGSVGWRCAGSKKTFKMVPSGCQQGALMGSGR